MNFCYSPWLFAIVIGMLARQLRLFLFSVVASIIFLLPFSVSASTYTVNSPADTNDGSCDAFVASTTDCTLGDAITVANGNPGTDTINFAIDSSFNSNSTFYDGDGQYTILVVLAAFDNITSPLIIDATSAWDTNNDRPGIRLNHLTKLFKGFVFSVGSNGSRVSGLEMNGFDTAIEINSTNFIAGTNCDGTNDAHERNVLHGGKKALDIQAANAIVAGNYFGLQTDGDTYDGYSSAVVTISGATTDDVIIGYQEGSTCTATQQRNVIAGPNTSNATISIIGTGSTNQSGSAALAPNGTRISGNYIGTNAAGTQDRTGKLVNSAAAGNAIQLAINPTQTIIGTDGDGVSDADERNVINASSTGISIVDTGNNRVAGNYIGTTADGNSSLSGSLVVGVILRGSTNIAGWCDTSIHAALCSNSGTAEDQRNVLGGASLDGIRFGVNAQNSYILGNYVGVGPNGNSDLGSAESGVFVHRATTNNVVGGTGNRANIIRNNAIGVLLEGDYIGNSGLGGNQTPITNTTITGNTITNNDSVGIRNYWTENYDTTVGPTDVTITNNNIQNNNGIGIDVWGSSPSITGNTIANNTTYGIYVHPGFVAYAENNEAYESYDPANASTNLLSQPIISSNSIFSNGTAGIYALDSKPNNVATIYQDNSFATQSIAYQQSWYAGLEILDKNNNPIPSSSWSTTIASAIDRLGTSTNSAASAAATGTNMIFGPTGVSYTNTSTWFVLTDYIINEAGTNTAYNPYTLQASGSYGTATTQQYTFNAQDDDTSYSGVLPNGITTGALYRFQVAKIITSTVPATPTNILPTDTSTVETLTPTLSASAFSDTIETHASSQWQIYNSSSACAAGGSGNVTSVSSPSALTNYTVPADALQGNTTYYWRVAYTNNYGNSSNYSTCTSFTTFQTAPQLVSSIPDQTWNEDSSLETAFDLDDYFTDTEGESLTYSVNVSDVGHITVSINSNNQVSFSASANWFGTATIEFTACDTDNECTTSNTVDLTINSVNDNPKAPTSGFSPADDAVISSRKPILSWNAGSDIEDAAVNLSYQVRISTSTHPATNPDYSLTSQVGKTSVSLQQALNDDTTYYYVVRTIDTTGAQSTWSDRQSFIVNTTVAPNLTIHKSLTVLQSDLSASMVGQAIAAGLGSTTDQVKLSAALTFATAASIFVVSLSGLSLTIRNARKLARLLLLRNPALGFASVVGQDTVGTYTQSYSQFRRQSIPLVRLAQISAVATILFFLLNLAVQAEPLAAEYTLAPEDTVRFSVTYNNIGDGAASNVMIEDFLVSDLEFLSTQGENSTAVIFNVGTISPGESGTVTYDARVKNPVSNSAITVPAANLTANELTEPLKSNTLAIALQYGTFTATVQDSNGKAIANANLELYSDSITDANLISTGSTNAEGKLTQFGFKAGTYYLVPRLSAQYSAAPQRITFNYNKTTAVLIIAVDQTNSGGENNNVNLNDNQNLNTNTNANLNANQNTNKNNSNTNIPKNSNESLNTNSNTNTPYLPPDLPITEEEEDFLHSLPPLTEEVIKLTQSEVAALKNAFTDSLNDLKSQINVEINNAPLHSEQLEDLLIFKSDTTCGIGQQARRWLNTLRAKKDNGQIIFTGNLDIPELLREKLKSSNAPVKIRIIVLSDPLVQVAEVDNEGQWRMEFPLQLLDDSEHLALAEISANGESSGVVEITKFAIEKPNCTPWSTLIIGINAGALVLVVTYVFWANNQKGKSDIEAV